MTSRCLSFAIEPGVRRRIKSHFLMAALPDGSFRYTELLFFPSSGGHHSDINRFCVTCGSLPYLSSLTPQVSIRSGSGQSSFQGCRLVSGLNRSSCYGARAFWPIKSITSQMTRQLPRYTQRMAKYRNIAMRLSLLGCCFVLA